MDDSTRLWSAFKDKVRELERRIGEVEFRFVRNNSGDGDLTARRIEVAERSIALLEAKALRPEDRPTRPSRDPAQEARDRLAASQAELRLNASRARSIEELEDRFNAVVAKIAVWDAGEKLKREKLEDLLNRLGMLEERCLLPNERPDILPPRLRGFDRPTSLPTMHGGPVGQV